MLFFRIPLALFCVLLGAVSSRAQDESPDVEVATITGQGGRIPIQIVAGKVVVSCDVSTAVRRIPVNLFLEYESPWGLQLHNRAAAPIGAERDDGTTRPISIHFPDFKLVVPRRELGDEELFEDFTKYHSKEIGENALVGSLGAEIFEGFHVVFDLFAGWIEVTPARPESPGAGNRYEDDDDVHTVPITLVNDLAWLPVRYEDGTPAAMALGTSRYDTVVDLATADQRGRPYGDLKLSLGRFTLSEFVAFRPEEVVQVHPDGVFGTAGLNLLRCFHVEVDRVNQLAHLTQTAPARYPVEELEFFEAMIDEDPVAVEAFLSTHGETSRLNHEAAELLLGLFLDEAAPEEECRRAIQWVHDTTLEDLRATRAHDLMLELGNEGRRDLAVIAGELGATAGRDDRYPNAVHELHSELGHILMDRGEGREAWRHLLSAAFGIPEDGRVNLDLGRYYESQGRHRRAFSRYVQAVIKSETAPAAAAALARVQELLPDEEPFSVALVERMIAGKVRNFGAATKFEPGEENPVHRTVLVEFFTNAHLGDERVGAIGGALGNQGLMSHFDSQYAVFLSYHLPSPVLDPLVNEVAEDTALGLAVTNPMVHRIDGTLEGPGAARWRQAEGVYNANRRLVLHRLAQTTDYGLSLEAAVADGEVSGTLRVEGPPQDSLRVHLVLAERGVLFPGKSTVAIHRNVARASLTGRIGVPHLPTDGVMEYPFEASLAELGQANLEYLDRLEESGLGTTPRMSMKIDAAQVVLVAFVRDDLTSEVLQAVQFDPTPDEEAR